VLRQSQRLRRELNSHEAAKPRSVVPLCGWNRLQATQRSRGAANQVVLLQSTRDHGGKPGANDLAPLCPLGPLHCVGTSELQFVRGAAGGIAPLSQLGAGGLKTRPATFAGAEREALVAWHAE